MTWKGFKYSMSKDYHVRIIPGSDLGLIESSINQILNTVPGERVHLPEFGSRLKLLAFSPLDEFLAIQIKTEIMEAINRWEDRIIISDVEVLLPKEESDAVDQEKVTAIVRYNLAENTKDTREFKISI